MITPTSVPIAIIFIASFVIMRSTEPRLVSEGVGKTPYRRLYWTDPRWHLLKISFCLTSIARLSAFFPCI
jgi:hypothetical protein